MRKPTRMFPSEVQLKFLKWADINYGNTFDDEQKQTMNSVLSLNGYLEHGPFRRTLNQILAQYGPEYSNQLRGKL